MAALSLGTSPNQLNSSMFAFAEVVLGKDFRRIAIRFFRAIGLLPSCSKSQCLKQGWIELRPPSGR